MSLTDKTGDLMLLASTAFHEAKLLLHHANYLAQDTADRTSLAEDRINLAAADLHEVARLCTQAAELLNTFNARVNAARSAA